MLTSREIRMILDALRTQHITLVVANGKVSTEIKKTSGYSDDSEVAALQAKLSIMLEAALRARS
jgi:hypothetical protein